MQGSALKAFRRSSKVLRLIEENPLYEQLASLSLTNPYKSFSLLYNNNKELSKLLQNLEQLYKFSTTKRNLSTATVLAPKARTPLSIKTDLYGSVVVKNKNE